MALHNTSKILELNNLHPVFLDIGASGKPQDILDPISRQSIYIGFDPDTRDTQDSRPTQYWKSFIINKAIVTTDDETKTSFFLTRSPYCSSTLLPDTKSICDYLFSDLFIVEKKITVDAISIDRLLQELNLSGIDWFKTDSQGTDLRLFSSISSQIRSRIMAVDIEPGLVDVYQGEDLFINAHQVLLKEGFWPSRLNIGKAIRMKRSNMDSLVAIHSRFSEKRINSLLHPSPIYCEARYLRSIDWLVDHNFSKREYILLWIFALLDDQPGYAFDIVTMYENLFERDNVFDIMRDDTLRVLKSRMSLHNRVKRIIKKIIQKVERHFLN